MCSQPEKTWTRPYDGKKLTDIDASIVTDHMMLEATDLGLGSLWVCWFKEDVIRQEFSIPDGMVPVNLLAIGYAQGEPASPDRHEDLRRPLEELVTFQ